MHPKVLQKGMQESSGYKVCKGQGHRLSAMCQIPRDGHRLQCGQVSYQRSISIDGYKLRPSNPRRLIFQNEGGGNKSHYSLETKWRLKPSMGE